MQVFVGFLVILLHWVAGNVISHFIGGFVPGSIVGMILLFFSLTLGIVREDSVRPVARFLTDNMTLFFLPAFMGIMDLWDVISMNLWAWLAVVAFSTVLVLLSSGAVAEAVDRISSGSCRSSEIKEK